MSNRPIALRGSSSLITEFFHYSIHSILYQRGLYDPDTFQKIQKYQLSLYKSQDQALQSYLNNILGQLEIWLNQGIARKLVLVITGMESEEILERWTFDILLEKQVKKCLTNGEDGMIAEIELKPEKLIQQEMSAILRQITSSVSFLPLLSEASVFDLLVYTDNECKIPLQWEESDPKYIENQQYVKLRGLNTNIHRVETGVSFKLNEPF